jgi:RHS repeat-associated protein
MERKLARTLYIMLSALSIGVASSFGFDGMNRMNSYSGFSVGYDNATGNITSKSDVGAIFSYSDPNNPYAITAILLGTVTPAYTTLPIRNQSVAYTSFDRPEQIVEDNLAATFTYNSSGERVKMNLANNGATTMNRYYLGGNYEADEPTGGVNREKLYLGGNYYNAPAVYVKDGAGSWQLYYILRDNLGSITHLVNTGGSVVQELSYDVWGRLRNPSTQIPYAPGSEPTLYLGRGYTGHEHLSQFGKINMNARLYDPSTGRFIYPDPVVQSPDNSQNYNRYAYCLNNPLKYTDPSGEVFWVPIIIGAVVGAYTGGVIANEGQYNPCRWDYQSGQTWRYMAYGAIVGGVSGYVGGVISTSGIPMASTAGIAASSFINSVGTAVYTDGQTPVSISIGVASYDFTNNELGYLGKKGNKWYEDVGYAMGALANLSDAVSLFRGGGQNVNVNSADTKGHDGWWGHSSITDENGNTLVSVGPPFEDLVEKTGSLSQTFENSIKEANLIWNNYYGSPSTWSVELNNISTNAINSYMSNVTRWDLLFNSCVGHTTRALLSAGVPTIYAFHPHLLNLQLLIRQFGIYLSPSLYQIP